MANVYMEEADFDDNDTWFHDGKSDEPIEQQVNVEVRDQLHVLVVALQIYLKYYKDLSCTRECQCWVGNFIFKVTCNFPLWEVKLNSTPKHLQ